MDGEDEEDKDYRSLPRGAALWIPPHPCEIIFGSQEGVTAPRTQPWSYRPVKREDGLPKPGNLTSSVSRDYVELSMRNPVAHKQTGALLNIIPVLHITLLMLSST